MNPTPASLEMPPEVSNHVQRYSIASTKSASQSTTVPDVVKKRMNDDFKKFMMIRARAARNFSGLGNSISALSMLNDSTRSSSRLAGGTIAVRGSLDNYVALNDVIKKRSQRLRSRLALNQLNSEIKQELVESSRQETVRSVGPYADIESSELYG